MGYREFNENDSIYQLSYGTSLLAIGLDSTVEYGKIQPVKEMDSSVSPSRGCVLRPVPFFRAVERPSPAFANSHTFLHSLKQI